MPLAEQNPSKDIWNAYMREIGYFLKQGDPSPSDIQPNEQHIHQMFTMGLDVLEGATSLKDAEEVGWHFLVGTRPGQAVNAVVGLCDGTPKLTGLSRGPNVSTALNALLKLKKFKEVKESNYRLSVLTIPGILTEAFWLTPVGKTAKEELIVPYLKMTHELDAKPFYGLKEFLSIVKPLAKKRLKFDSEYMDCGPGDGPEEDDPGPGGERHALKKAWAAKKAPVKKAAPKKVVVKKKSPAKNK